MYGGRSLDQPPSEGRGVAVSERWAGCRMTSADDD